MKAAAADSESETGRTVSLRGEISGLVSGASVCKLKYTDVALILDSNPAS